MPLPGPAGPSNPRTSHIPLVPAALPTPNPPVAAQFRFEAPAGPKRRSRAAGLTRSLLGLGLRRGSARDGPGQASVRDGAGEIATFEGGSGGQARACSFDGTVSPKLGNRKACMSLEAVSFFFSLARRLADLPGASAVADIHHSPRLSEPLSPPLSQVTDTAPRPRVDLPTTDRWCLSIDIAGLDPVPLDDADHVVFSSSYRPLSHHARPDLDPRHLAPATQLESHWSDASSSAGSFDDEYELNTNPHREASIYKAELVPALPREASRAASRAANTASSAASVSSATSSRSSSPGTDRSHARKDSIATQATSAFSSPQVVHTSGTTFELCSTELLSPAPRQPGAFSRNVPSVAATSATLHPV